ncbi:protein of unknown function [Pseudomonas mediterranea]
MHSLELRYPLESRGGTGLDDVGAVGHAVVPGDRQRFSVGISGLVSVGLSSEHILLCRKCRRIYESHCSCHLGFDRPADSLPCRRCRGCFGARKAGRQRHEKAIEKRLEEATGSEEGACQENGFLAEKTRAHCLQEQICP